MASMKNILEKMKKNLLFSRISRPYLSGFQQIGIYSSDVSGFHEQTLYLAPVSSLEEIIKADSDMTVFIYDGHSEDVTRAEAASLLNLNLVLTDYPLQNLYSLLNRILEKYRSRTENLTELALRTNSIQTLFDYVSQKTGLELFMINRLGTAINEKSSNTNYPELSVNVSGGQELLADPHVCLYEHESDGGFFLTMDVQEEDSLSAPARICMHGTNGLKSTDCYGLLLAIGNAVLKIADTAELDYWLSNSLERFLENIINRKHSLTKEQIKAKLTSIFGYEYRFLSFAIAKLGDKTAMHQTETLKILEECIPGSIGAFYRNLVVLVVPLERALFKVQVQDDRLHDFLRSKDGFIAFGNGTSLPEKLRSMYLLTETLLSLGMMLRPSNHVRCFYFSDYSSFLSMKFIVDGFKQLTGDDGDVLVLGDPDCVRLFQYDVENKDNLLDVLYFYLLCNRSIQKAAAAGYMHRNTISYKLKKINEILGIELNELPDTSRMFFSAQLYRLYFRMLNNPFTTENQTFNIQLPSCLNQSFDDSTT